MFSKTYKMTALMCCVVFAMLGMSIQSTYAKTIAYKLGTTTIKIIVARNGTGPTFISLHDNENTAVRAVAGFRGTLVQLRHTGKRNIVFKLKGIRYEFDPNRMFTSRGIKNSLLRLGKQYTPEAHIAVSAFAETVLRYVKGNVIALHNSTNGNYSILSYMLGGSLEKDAVNVHINKKHDPDNFFFVTSFKRFAQLKAVGFNVVQQSRSVTNDGSLSVYCTLRCSEYINVEAQHGNVKFQKKMLGAL